MDFSQLDLLMKITKKGEASKEKKELFSNLIKASISENGYSKQDEKYFYAGFSFSGAKPIAEYILSLPSDDERAAFFKSITNSTLFYLNDRGSTFKYMISLLGNLIFFELDDYQLLSSIIIKIPGLASNKEGNPWGDVTKTVEKYLVAALSENTKFPNVEALELKPALFDKFSGIIIQSLTDKSISPKYVPIAEKIIQWLTGSTTNIKSAELLHDAKPDTAVIDTPKAKKSKADELREIADHLVEIERKYKNFQSEYERLKSENLALSKKVEKTKADLEAVERVRTGLEEKNNQLHLKNISLSADLASANLKNEALNAELQKHNSVLSIFESDKQNSQKEQLNGIASKLKAEYKDFVDALDMQMTVDLGENMRQQLAMIFRILSKNGIDVEGRL